MRRDALLERVERVFDEVGPTRQIRRLHGDCHLGNLLWNEHGPVFVDLDDCMTGPAIQDLWMLLSGPAADQQRQWREPTEGYEQFAMLDYGELRLIEPLRAFGCCITQHGSPRAGVTRHSPAHFRGSAACVTGKST